MLALTACGGGQEQSVSEPHGNFPVSIVIARFPSSQTLSQHIHLVLVVRNSGSKAIPNLAVTICNITCRYPAPAGLGTSSAAFASSISGTGLANPSRPIWIIDRAPGRCSYSCTNGGQGAYVTAYANTWAIGKPLPPGHVALFNWAVTAVKPGIHVVAWQVAAGLNGKAKAVLASGGGQPHGAFVVHISSKPSQTYVNNNGQIVNQQ
jgi:hypothetical protein